MEIPVVPLSSPAPYAETSLACPACSGDPTMTLNEVTRPWGPNLTSTVWRPCSRGMKRIEYLSGTEGRSGYYSARDPHSHIQYTRTFFQVFDGTLLLRSRRAGDLSLGFSFGSFHWHVEGRRLIHLQTRLLQHTRDIYFGYYIRFGVSIIWCALGLYSYFSV